ncbi:uncharacterized protein isoform X1 [Macaca fascicularis]|uniref:uncharacterized protein isoform X1 n=1 Tax=Macaca fascicularis TaxID=9541 RepID=UPI0032B082FD
MNGLAHPWWWQRVTSSLQSSSSHAEVPARLCPEVAVWEPLQSLKIHTSQLRLLAEQHCSSFDDATAIIYENKERRNSSWLARHVQIPFNCLSPGVSPLQRGCTDHLKSWAAEDVAGPCELRCWWESPEGHLDSPSSTWLLHVLWPGLRCVCKAPQMASLSDKDAEPTLVVTHCGSSQRESVLPRQRQRKATSLKTVTHIFRFRS